MALCRMDLVDAGNARVEPYNHFKGSEIDFEYRRYDVLTERDT